MFKHNWAWIKLATDNFSTVLTRNLRNPRDNAPLRSFTQTRIQVSESLETQIRLHSFRGLVDRNRK